MRLKYKKAILLVLISSMGIGVVTLSVSPNNHAKENSKAVNPVGTTLTVTEAPLSVTPYIEEISVTPMPTPTQTALPVYSLEEEGYPEITDFFKSYYEAKLDCNLKQLKNMFTDPTGMPTKAKLKEEVQFIDEYQKMKCYVKKSYQEGTYIVYVYYEIKYMNIDTPVPAMSQFYLITDEDRSLKIYSGEFDEVTKQYYNARKQDEDVQKLSEQTDKKLKKALKKDETLKTFYNKLLEIQTNNEE